MVDLDASGWRSGESAKATAAEFGNIAASVPFGKRRAMRLGSTPSDWTISIYNERKGIAEFPLTNRYLYLVNAMPCSPVIYPQNNHALLFNLSLTSTTTSSIGSVILASLLKLGQIPNSSHPNSCDLPIRAEIQLGNILLLLDLNVPCHPR